MKMFHNIMFVNDQPMIALLQCFILAVSFVGSLYVYKSQYPRDHPVTIMQRFKSVAVISLVGPLFVYFCGTVDNTGNSYPFSRLLGLHTENILLSLFLPLLLTVILFLGPIVLNLLQDGVADMRDVTKGHYLTDLRWYRTFIVAPFTEEFIFRACMLPILLPNFGLIWSILLAPLFFGVAHFHHVIEQLRAGQKLVPVLLAALFQMSYTTLFGFYTAFLFLRTGHLIGPVVCHSFCNFMGFPDFEGIPTCSFPKLVSFLFIFSLLLFSRLLFPLTEPYLFDSIYWT